jgi:hypothetical protein
MDANEKQWARPLMTRLASVLCALFVLSGCASPPAPKVEAPPAKPIPEPAPITSPEPAQPSALSYGIVTSQVRKGVTTQLDLVQLFGSPNISTFDSAGTESWVYERTVTRTEVQSQAKSAQAAANLGVFFGSGEAGGAVSGGQSSSSGSATTSVRSITVVVKFAPDKTVADYSVRASYF